MSSNDSSEDENLEQLREAVCSQFLNEAMFNGLIHKDGVSENRSATTEILPSLRLTHNKDDQFNSVNVPPQVQHHIAKCLSDLLDKKLEKIVGVNECPVTSIQKRKKGGIKLFSNSKKPLKLNRQKVVKQVVSNNYSDNSDNEIKCSEIAVNSDTILSKKEVMNWSSRSKAEVFRYKCLDNGTLVSLD